MAARLAVRQVPGVLDARFSYEESSGVVTYDAERTDPAAFIEELAVKTGFEARVVASGASSAGDAKRIEVDED